MKHFDLASEVLNAAKKRGWKIATAESCTGGMVAAALTDVAGSSDVFDCGFVTYSYGSKIDTLLISQETLDRYGAVSQEIATEMAQGAFRNSAADITVAITGVAGPGADGIKPEGMVCFALATNEGVTSREVHFGPLGRENVRLAAVEVALKMLLAALR